jgi:hypothetical protein
MNKITTVTIIAVIAIIGGLIYWGKTWSGNAKSGAVKSLEDSGDLVSQGSIHWHPELSVYIKGEQQAIPVNIGIGMQYASDPRFDSTMGMTNMHTHDGSGTIHWEVMNGPVTKEDVRLGNFFEVWDKKFDSSCILENCNGSEGTVKMFVNGKPNTEYQNYLVKDGDKIEIRYE